MIRDLGVTRFVRDHLPEWVVPVADAVTLLGDLLLIVGGLALMILLDVRRSRRRSGRPLVTDRTAFIVGVVLGGLALTLILKTVVGAARPPAELQAFGRSGYGFPSGHTMAATVLWGALAIWGLWGTRRVRLLGASAIVGLVAFSRLALGVHYLVDVFVSIALGVVFLVFAGTVFEGDPRLALATAAVLGIVALVATGANTDGLLAFAGCVGGATVWWLLERPTGPVWRSVARYRFGG